MGVHLFEGIERVPRLTFCKNGEVKFLTYDFLKIKIAGGKVGLLG